MKSPAKHILVEDSVVRQGNGLVIGTSDGADFENITFRNCTAIGTAFGCHIKFKDAQVGKPGVRDILFENISIVNPTRYAIGIDQNGQGAQEELLRLRAGAAAGSRSSANVPINNVTYRNVKATFGDNRRASDSHSLLGGLFTCNAGPLACRSIEFDNVDLGTGVGSGCLFKNVCGRGVHVSPASCVPPGEATCGRDTGAGDPAATNELL
eukprot:SAG22_NODE_1183_length_5231_cov_6.467069_7_plen_210_part_00